MTDLAIEVSALSKKYRLRRGFGRQPQMFREQLALALRLRRRPQVDLRGSRQSFWALRDVSFDVARGERLALIGANGAGKSTLVKVLARLTTPTAGRIRMRGTISALASLDAGFHPDLSGRDNVFLKGAIHGLRRRDMARRLDEIVAFAELDKFIDFPVKCYSSGMRTRLAFAVAMHLDPEILLLDEVLAVGDDRFREKSLDRMRLLAGEGRTVVFVSHSMSAVRALCDRAVLLHEGRVVEVGPVDDVIERYLPARAEPRRWTRSSA